MFFFDTYALFEKVVGNEDYTKYFKGRIICTVLNLFELHQALLREFNKKTADFWINNFDYSLLKITTKDIIDASSFRFKNKEKKLSSIDAIGYAVAKNNNLKFLTGDEGFKNIDNVEFVK